MNPLRKSFHPATLVVIVLCFATICQHSAAQQQADDPKATASDKQKSPDKKSSSKPSSDKKAPEKKPKATQKITAITGVKVITMSAAGTLENATILIEGQQIKAVGTDVKVPKHATTIVANGMTVTPGLIDCRSSLWLASDSVSASASNGGLNALDAVDPFSDSWQEVASQGITTVCMGPKGSLGGQSVVLRVAPATSTEELLIKAKASMQGAIGLSGSTGNSKDRYARYEAVKKTLTAAKAYKESWDKYNEAVKKAKKVEKTKPTSKKTTKPATTPKTTTQQKATPKKTTPPKKPKKDPLKDILVQVLNKELPLRIEAHRSDDIAHAMQLAKDFDLTVTFEGVSHAGRQWKTLKEKHPALVVGPFSHFESVPTYANSKKDRYDALTDYDGLMAIATFSTDSRASRFLRFQAAAAIRRGIPSDVALKAITINAAQILGIDDQIGSIETGKLADLVVTSSNPVNPAAAVMLTMSHGEIVYRNDSLKPATDARFADAITFDSDLPNSFALSSDRVLYPNGQLAPGTVLVKAGKIVAVRKSKPKASKFQVIDVGSAVVTPGLIVSHFSEVSVKATNAVTAQIQAIDALPPKSQTLRDLSQQGFTTVMYAPGSESVVAGQIGSVRIHGDPQVLSQKNGPVLPASKFVLSNRSRSSTRFPVSLSGQLSLIRQYFAGSAFESNMYLPRAAKKLLEDQQIQLLESLKNQSKVAIIEASVAAEIEAAIKVTEQFDLQTLILHPHDPIGSLEQLKKQKIGMIARTALVSDHDWYAKDMATAANAGVKVLVSGNDATELRQTLATFVNAGMTHDAALRAITSDAAASFGLKRVGRLAKGAFADIVIWDESPLNLSARPIHVIVGGRLTKDLK